MDDLVTWLLAQVAEDERLALSSSPGPWHPNAEQDEVLAVDDITVCEGFALSNNQLRATVDHVAAWDPARVLAECEAKRRLIAQFKLRGDSVRRTVQPSTGGVWDDLLRLVALPYAHRSDYKEAWRP